jgi:hypothetical protein
MTRRARKKVDVIYAKVDVKLLGHPKMIRACSEDSGAFELYVRGLLWSKQNETDGVIPFGALQMMGYSGSAIDTANVLVAERLWHAFPDGYGVNDYDRYQRTRTEVQARSKAGRKGAVARWERDSGSKRSASDSHAKRNAKSMPDTDTDTDTVKGPHRRASSTWPTIWSAYTARHPTTKPTEKRRRLLAAREREGYDEQTLLAAIEGNHADPWCAGDNPGGKTYHSFELIFRDAAHVEQYAAVAQNGNGGESRLDRAHRIAVEKGFA